MIEPKVGDTVRLNAVVSDITEHEAIRLYFFRMPGTGTSSQPRFQMSQRSLNLCSPEIVQPSSPGERAYEASFAPDEVHTNWHHLDITVRARWDRIAEAARS
jgi:hypothetical protein